MATIFQAQHEAGNMSEWDSHHAAMQAVADTSLQGSYAVSSTPNNETGSRRAQKAYTVPASKIVHWAARFDLRMIEKIGGTSDYTFLMRDQGQRLQLRLYVTGSDATEDLQHDLRILWAGATESRNSRHMIAHDAPFTVELVYFQDDTNGYIQLIVDGVALYTSDLFNTDEAGDSPPSQIQIGPRCSGSTSWEGSGEIRFDDVRVTDTADIVFPAPSGGETVDMGYVETHNMAATSVQPNREAVFSLAASSGCGISCFMPPPSTPTRLFSLTNEGITLPAPESGGQSGVDKEMNVPAAQGVEGGSVAVGATLTRVGAASPLTAPAVPWDTGYPTSKRPDKNPSSPPAYSSSPFLYYTTSEMSGWVSEADSNPGGVRDLSRDALLAWAAGVGVSGDGVIGNNGSQVGNAKNLVGLAVAFGIATGSTRDDIGLSIFRGLKALNSNDNWEGGTNRKIDKNSGETAFNYAVAFDAILPWLDGEGHEGDLSGITIRDCYNLMAREAIRNYIAFEFGKSYHPETEKSYNSTWTGQYFQNHLNSTLVGYLALVFALKNAVSSDITQTWNDPDQGISGSGSGNRITPADIATYEANAMANYNRQHYAFHQVPDGCPFEGTGYGINALNGDITQAVYLVDRVKDYQTVKTSPLLHMYPVYLAYGTVGSGWSRRMVGCSGDIHANWNQQGGNLGAMRWLARELKTQSPRVAEVAQWVADRLVATLPSGTNNFSGRYLREGPGWSYDEAVALEFVSYDSAVSAVRPDLQSTPWPTFFRGWDLDIIFARAGFSDSGFQHGARLGLEGRWYRDLMIASGMGWNTQRHANGTFRKHPKPSRPFPLAEDQADRENGDPGFPSDLDMGLGHVKVAGTWDIFDCNEDSYARVALPGKKPTKNPYGRRADTQLIIGVDFDGSRGPVGARGHTGVYTSDGSPGEGTAGNVYPNDAYASRKSSPQEDYGGKNWQHDREDFDLTLKPGDSVGSKLWAGTHGTNFWKAELHQQYTRNSKSGHASNSSANHQLDEFLRFVFIDPATGDSIDCCVVDSPTSHTYRLGTPSLASLATIDGSVIKAPAGGSGLYCYDVIRPTNASFDGHLWESRGKLPAGTPAGGTEPSTDNESTMGFLTGTSGGTHKMGCMRVVFSGAGQRRCTSFGWKTTTADYNADKPDVFNMADDTTKVGVRVQFNGSRSGNHVYLIGHHVVGSSFSITHSGETYTVTGSAASVKKASQGGTVQEVLLVNGTSLQEGSTTYISVAESHQCIRAKATAGVVEVDAYKEWMARVPTKPDTFDLDMGVAITSVKVNGVTATATLVSGTRYTIG